MSDVVGALRMAQKLFAESVVRLRQDKYWDSLCQQKHRTLHFTLMANAPGPAHPYIHSPRSAAANGALLGVVVVVQQLVLQTDDGTTLQTLADGERRQITVPVLGAA